jgi:hypothetical protein
MLSTQDRASAGGLALGWQKNMRTVILLILLMCGAGTLAEEKNSSPIVGAIRWDAWTGGEITAQVERSLGPKKYHGRLPWFAQVIDDGRVRIDGSPQAVMDQEIAFASTAGLDYWAFLLYPEASSMSQSLKSYLRSATRGKVKFCVILHNAFGVSDEQWPRERDRAVALLKEPGYQTVLAGRPLVYEFGVRFRGEFPAQRFADFLRAAHEAGVNPYCVFMGWNPASDFRNASVKGFDAVSAYAYGSADATFTGLCQAVEKQYWQNAVTAGVPYVPLVTTGWDKQPRKDNPVSWEKGHSYHQQAIFPSAATPQEISAHLERAIKFVKKNNAVCAANAIIIYSWNEHDEGGWLVPTWTPVGKPNTERLDAIGRILNNDTNVVQRPAAADALPRTADR